MNASMPKHFKLMERILLQNTPSCFQAAIFAFDQHASETIKIEILFSLNLRAFCKLTLVPISDLNTTYDALMTHIKKYSERFCYKFNLNTIVFI